jgi:hypothetical protein
MYNKKVKYMQSQISMKAFQSTEEVTNYRNIQDFKHKISLLFCRVIFALSGSGSNPDRDPSYCRK